MTRVAIFDYGAGNIFSLENSLRREGAAVDVISDLAGDGGQQYDGLLLPGVGNFDPAMRAVTKRSRESFSEYVRGGMPVLGIGLGMEMFFEKSEEGSEPGLGVLDGEVVSLPHTMKVPHMGWNNLGILLPDSVLLDGVRDGSWVYFVHSYIARPSTRDDIITAESDYNDIVIPALVEYKNYFGAQFHPEKSGPVGRQMIRNFLGACRR